MSIDIAKLKSTADIIGGELFFATENGSDPENLDYTSLLPNGLYIRLNGSDGSFTYISAYDLYSIVETVKDIPNKAEKSDVELLQSILDDKADASDVELLQNEVSTKSSKAELSESVISINDTIDENVPVTALITKLPIIKSQITFDDF